VRLWDDELEALRPKLREESATFVASIPWTEAPTPGTSAEDMVAGHFFPRLFAFFDECLRAS
jgi:hypothetical protein